MHNTSFRFLDSPASRGLLLHALSQVGLSEREAAEQEAPDERAIAPDPNHPACLRFDCPWLSEPVEVHWHYDWWPDGTESELGRVSVVYQGVIRGEVNAAELLRQRLERPLAEVIVEGIVAACANVTGKHKRASKRESSAGK
jgi:hypothetical protein